MCCAVQVEATCEVIAPRSLSRKQPSWVAFAIRLLYSSGHFFHTMATDTDGIVERILGASNHFEVFDMPPVEVNGSTITKLYRRLALKVHPDKCRHPDGPEAFRRLTVANDTLSDPGQQRIYLREFAEKAKADFAKAMQRKARAKAEAAERAAAEEARKKAARAAEEQALKEAIKADKKKERELRWQQAEAQKAREAAEAAAAEEARAAEAAAMKEEARKKAKALSSARRRLRNTRAALEAAAAEEAAAAGSADGTNEALPTEDEVELLCVRLPESDLVNVVVALLTGDASAVAAAVAKAEKEAAAEAAETAAANAAAAVKRREASEAVAAAKAAASQWSDQERAALVKAAKQQGQTFQRVGGNANWDAVALYVNTTCECQNPRQGDACRTEFRRLANEHRRVTSPPTSKAASSSQLPTPPARSTGAASATTTGAEMPPCPPSSKQESESSEAASGAAANALDDEWTDSQQQALEAALAAHPAVPGDPSARWKAIGKAVEGKSAKQCLARFKTLRAALKARHEQGEN